MLDAHSRRVVGWSIDSHQATSLVTNVLAMAISNRMPSSRTVIHSDHGSQFTSWAFSERVRQAGLVPSMGTIGNAYDNALIEAFWARLQTELLNRKKWKTRIELSTALFDYLEIFHNRNRRHSVLGMLTPIEFEPQTPPDSHTPSPRNRGQTSLEACSPEGMLARRLRRQQPLRPIRAPLHWSGLFHSTL